MTKRHIYYIIFFLLSLIIYHSPLRELMSLSLSYNSHYSHIMLIPLISGYLVLNKRQDIFYKVNYGVPGIFIVLSGMLLYAAATAYVNILNRNDTLALMVLSALMTWIGGFYFFYGSQAFVRARFPLLFLVFMVPIPSVILENIIFILQKFSSETANVLFMISGIPYHNEGFIFHLSDLTVEVAEQCSGIRSSLALFIGSILAGHMFLRSTWSKVVLSLVVFPISIFRNGSRIVMLSLLGNYVDPAILSGDLHRKGGIPLFIVSFVFLMSICWFLRRSERKQTILKNQMYSQNSVE